MACLLADECFQSCYQRSSDINRRLQIPFCLEWCCKWCRSLHLCRKQKCEVSLDFLWLRQICHCACLSVRRKCQVLVFSETWILSKNNGVGISAHVHSYRISSLSLSLSHTHLTPPSHTHTPLSPTHPTLPLPTHTHVRELYSAKGFELLKAEGRLQKKGRLGYLLSGMRNLMSHSLPQSMLHYDNHFLIFFPLGYHTQGRGVNDVLSLEFLLI